jgi:signal transduction histidine kinase
MPHPRQPASAFRQPRRTLRTRLALLYAELFFATGVVLIAIADVPVLTVNHTSQKPAASVPGSVPVNPQPAGNLHQVLAYSGAALGVLAVLSVALGWLVAGRALRPLRIITASARAISASNLHERLGLDSPYNEFTELGETLDGLFGRLEASFASQRHFVANASHELRTPLTAERTLLQVALADPDATAETLRATCRQLLELGEQQERLIEALLTLASSQRGIDRWEPFDLAGIISDVVGQRRQEAERRGIRVDATLSAALAAGDPSLAGSLVANLVDNAIRHNVPGGWIKISAATSAGAATISVSNTGPVILQAEVGRLFQPFQRLGAERTRHAGGHGLGLAIVYAIAIAHGAALTAHPRPEGGLDVEVRFPRSSLSDRGGSNRRPQRRMRRCAVTIRGERDRGREIPDGDRRAGLVGTGADRRHRA